MVFCHLCQQGILLIAELDLRRVYPPDAVRKLDDTVDLPNLASRVTAPQRTRIYHIGPMLSAMEISKLAIYLTEPGFPSDFTIQSSHSLTS